MSQKNGVPAPFFCSVLWLDLIPTCICSESTGCAGQTHWNAVALLSETKEAPKRQILIAMDTAICWREAEGSPFNPQGDVWLGPQTIFENLFTRLESDWENFHVNPTTFTEAGQRVVVEGRYTAKHRSTDRSIDAQFCHIWDIEAGKVTAFQGYMDTAQLQLAVGQPDVLLDL